jgi:hypothetical protein
MPAAAVPVTYTFTTGPQAVGLLNPPETLGFFSTGVSGSLVYDSDAPLTTTFSAPGPGSDIDLGYFYGSALVSISGSVDGRSFSDAAGFGVALSNDTYSPPPTQIGRDLLTISADPFQLALGTSRSLAGFDIGGYRLVNVRLFWIEGLIPGNPDFLSDTNLPGALPEFVGRLALDFVPVDFVPGEVPVGPRTFAFFDNLVLTPSRPSVPEPSTVLLLAVGLSLLLLMRRRRPARAIN